MELKELLHLLEERLVQHNNNRKEIQSQLQELCSKISGEADFLEEKINKELLGSFALEEERILSLIEKISNEDERENNYELLINQVREELSIELRYEIGHSPSADKFANSYKLKINKAKNDVGIEGEISADNVVKQLKHHLNKARESMFASQNKIVEIRTKKRNETEIIEGQINKKLETYFQQEDSRLQCAVALIRGNINNENPEETEEIVTKAKTVLVVKQNYKISNSNGEYELIAEKETSLKMIDFEKRKPSNINASFTDEGNVTLSFTFFSDEEIKLLNSLNLIISVAVCIYEKGDDNKVNSKTYKMKYVLGSTEPICIDDIFSPGTTYCSKLRIVHSGLFSLWSDELVEFTTPAFKTFCAWRKCPNYVKNDNRYSLVDNNHRVVTKTGNGDFCTIIGNVTLPPSKVVSWNIKILEFKKNSDIYIGVVPFDIDQNEDNNIHKYWGWYFNCYDSSLYSGPPQNYKNKKYGPMMLFKKSIDIGTIIGVIMNLTSGSLSFSVSGKSYGVAYEGIPLDKPLVPCVILGNDGDSVELTSTEVNEYKVDNSIPIPSNVSVKSDVCNLFALTWDNYAKASFYQVEIDGNKQYEFSPSNKFEKKGLLTSIEHKFRVRVVKRNKVSKWSDIVKAKALKASEFSECIWKECPDDEEDCKKYSVYFNNPRIATKIGFSQNCEDVACYSVIIGSTPLPLNEVTSWSIKVLKSRDNNSENIFVGVAPFDISQIKFDFNCNKCGWYFDCYSSSLYSGPPHYYENKDYGLWKENGSYVKLGESVGIMMDTSKGELSFILNGVNYGVAYEGIPLDKPLVPCVLLGMKGDSVELDTYKAKINEVDRSIPVPYNVIAKNLTWYSIILMWDDVNKESLYQIELDGTNSGDASTTILYTKRGFLPGTEHSFRVRAVKGNSVSEWSDAVIERTQEATDFSECAWEKCPEYVNNKYSVGDNNPRIAINNGYFDKYCTIIGDKPLPLDKITSWIIKILKSESNDSYTIYVGVAPSDIDQNDDLNYKKSGWYFNCYDSTLWSGPPHNYEGKEYGPRKEEKGDYVHTGGCVGIVMDTDKSELSFVLNGMNPGIAYFKIPLNKPLVSCVILGLSNDSVELMFTNEN